MGIYRTTFRREVSRTVWLKQEATLYIKADDEAKARKAADALLWDKDQVDENCNEWREVDGSRQASNDDEESSPGRTVESVCPARVNDVVASLALDAAEILDEHPDTEEEDDV